MYVEARGLRDFEDLIRHLGAAVEPSAASAINDTAVFARRIGSQEVRRLINFKAGYVDGGRLSITKRATAKALEAAITGRDRPTSLARFAQGQPTFGKQKTAPRVRVSARGGAQTVRRAFYIRLRRGNSVVTAENANIGLAIRLAEGERVENKKLMGPLGGGLYLLYGPSVGQVYRTVAESSVDRVGDALAERFSHYLRRSIDGRL